MSRKFGPTKEKYVPLSSMISRPFEDLVVFDTSYGPFLEYTPGVSSDIPDLLEVFGTHLQPNVFEQFASLLNPRQLQNIYDTYDCTEWMTKTCGTLEQRAECVRDIAEQVGWKKIDSHPLILTPRELALRWTTPPPLVTSKGLRKPAELIPQLLILLNATATDRYWLLFQPPFPIIPSEALQNLQSPWWEQHGQQAVVQITDALKACCPRGYRFLYQDGRYGFWPTS